MEKETLFWSHLPIWPLGARVDLPKVRGSAGQGMITNSNPLPTNTRMVTTVRV